MSLTLLSHNPFHLDNLEHLILNMEDADARLCGAHASYLEVGDELAQAKYLLELAKARALKASKVRTPSSERLTCA